MEKFAREREQTPDRAERTDTLVWGKNAVTELLKSGGAVDTVYLTDAMPQAVAGYYTALSKESGAVVKRVPANKLQKMCGTPDHQGVAARAAEVAYASLDDLFKAAQAKDEPPFLVSATESRIPTIWGPSCALRICAGPTVLSSPSAAVSA